MKTYVITIGDRPIGHISDHGMRMGYLSILKQGDIRYRVSECIACATPADVDDMEVALKGKVVAKSRKKAAA